MRVKERIPIALKLFETNTKALREFTGSSIYNTSSIVNNWNTIKKYWNENYDQRFGQVLVNLGLLDHFNTCWFKEEDDWLVENKYCKLEDIKFWISILDENNNPLKTPKYTLLKDMDNKHIKAILLWFKDKSSRIDSRYIKYFNEKIEI